MHAIQRNNGSVAYYHAIPSNVCTYYGSDTCGPCTVEDNNSNTEYHSRQKQRISILLFIGILIFCSDKG